MPTSWRRLAGLLSLFATACVGPSGGAGPAVATPTQPPDLGPPDQSSYQQPQPTPPAIPRGRARASNCPAPPAGGSKEFAQLVFLSRTLFYVRENHPQDISPRAREMVVKALEAVAAEESEVRVERDSGTSPLWVTVTVTGQPCTLNLERVDAPWSLRTTLQEAMRFVQGHLTAPVDERLLKLEIAATNGMLSVLDAGSRLLDAETYRELRPHIPRQGSPSGPSAADARPIPAPDAKSSAAATPMRVAPGPGVLYLRLHGFSPGLSAAVERALAASEGERPQGIVLDLRDNTGGLLDEAVKVADAFVPSGTLGSIVGKQRKDLLATTSGHEPSGAVVVLVDRQTASGSELVAAAIKNLGRGVVLGEPTAGAASVRVFFDIPQTRDLRASGEGGEPLGLLLMTGRLLAAGGAEIERTGVRPDLQPAWPVTPPARPEDDCLLQLAKALVVRAGDPRRPTLLATAKALADQMTCATAAR